MSETYCGKTCEDCVQKEQMNCSGCRVGPGRQFGGECELAQCARSKGHETCATCVLKSNCNLLCNCAAMPEYRRRKTEEEERRKASLARRIPALRKWLLVLFWLSIGLFVPSLMTNETAANTVPGLLLPGQILNTILSAAYGMILLKLDVAESRYRRAGICMLISCGCTVLAAIMAHSESTAIFAALLTLPADLIGLVGRYNEYMAHSAVLYGGVDGILADKWNTLWKWFIGLYLGVYGYVILSAISVVLGGLALIAVGIGLIVVCVLELVYLYRTAKAFRNYPLVV